MSTFFPGHGRRLVISAHSAFSKFASDKKNPRVCSAANKLKSRPFHYSFHRQVTPHRRRSHKQQRRSMHPHPLSLSYSIFLHVRQAHFLPKGGLLAARMRDFPEGLAIFGECKNVCGHVKQGSSRIRIHEQRFMHHHGPVYLPNVPWYLWRISTGRGRTFNRTRIFGGFT